MNGAESLVHTLLKSGIDTCFANPGTSEMHFVSALDRIPGMRCVLALAETVVTGAADGYARMAGRPAATLLHCGPGLANGLANLHNARRAHSSIVNIVGDQATHHRPLDAPLTADTEGWARPVSAWTRTSSTAETIGRDAAAAVQAARASNGQIATLIAPSDTCWNPGGVVADALDVPPAPTVDEGVLSAVARVLRSGEPAMLFMGNDALLAGPLAAAGRITHKTGARMMAQTSNRRIERGAGRQPIPRLPYAIEPALAALKGVKHLILVGSKAPVGFFAYPDKPALLYPEDCQIHVLSRPEQNQGEALARLADMLAAQEAAPVAERVAVEAARGAVTSEAVAQTVTALLPEHAIVIDESVSFGRAFYPGTVNAAPHDWLQITGGAIGNGLPLATGAAIGAPGRRVVSLQADGSAMYSLQALWTQAREQLDVTTVILANRKYAILIGELSGVGAEAGKTAMNMLDLTRPTLDWVKLANGMGVEAAQAQNMEQFADLLAAANKRKGPFVIELVI
ncbi:MULTISPECIES: acetolactate synthase large subunit [unclassified Achromobacter]|uniref:acetolactate synthase large subunit n=1 Tax=unclassified Achromobacter TaxID=2626865 RepID=UPI000B515AD8|nr:MULTISPECIES: acetolactate synthase large subunit [unclassified Achromobacter]OWT77290.1 acetolactate synthase large subunit [Achromobacter sp. HZ28]OWT78171.1 acetolactate synthase large subunit [Achromobacter sp. HZ34]